MKEKNYNKKAKIGPENKTAFLVTILQITLVLMLVTTATKFYIDQTIFFAAQILLSIVFLKVLLVDLKKELKQEHKFSLYFFGPLYIIVQGAWILIPLFSDNSVFFIALVLSIFIYTAIFKILFGRNYTLATVLLSNETTAVLQTNYDIRYFCTGQKFIAQTDKKIKEGSEVKIAIKRDFLGKKTPKIV